MPKAVHVGFQVLHIEHLPEFAYSPREGKYSAFCQSIIDQAQKLKKDEFFIFQSPSVHGFSKKPFQATVSKALRKSNSGFKLKWCKKREMFYVVRKKHLGGK